MTTRLGCLVTLLALASTLRVAQAQPIVPATDGTGTIVTPVLPTVPHDPTIYTITGGSLSGDQHNLFHSFQQFGLEQNQIANFIADPQLQNILGRITGGDPSVINGIIQVTGGSPHLYLLNPAGIMFGNNATINVPASFTATTATGLGFSNGSWWDLGHPVPNYSTLMGNPASFLFSATQAASLVNTGTLSVSSGQSLNLVGGTVVNTGKLSAPGGTITVMSVPGSSRVRLSSPGSLLSLDIEGESVENRGQHQAALLPISPASLPMLLTGSGLSAEATGLAVEADGTVRLRATATVMPQQAGITLASGTISTAATIPGTVQLLGDRVGLFAATVDASGAGGGTVLIGGGYQGLGQVPNAQRTVVDSTSTITANALQTGDGGRVVVWADGSTDFRGAIVARGGQTSGSGGFAEISGRHSLAFQGQVDLSAPNGNLGTVLFDPENIEIFDGAGPGTNDATLPDVLEPGDPGTVFRIAEKKLESFEGANIILQASNNIVINDLSDNALQLRSGFPPLPGAIIGSVTFTAGGDFIMNRGDTIVANQRNFSISANNIIAGTIDTSDNPVFLSQSRPAGFINLIARNNIVTGNLTANSRSMRSGGSITVISSMGSVQTGTIDSSVASPSLVAPGAVTITAPLGITTGAINAAGAGMQDINLSSTSGSIRTGSLQGRTINLSARDNLQVTGTVAASAVNSAISGIAGPVSILSRSAVTLRHGGGNDTPFIVGDATVNGVAAAITTGTTTLAPPFTVPPGIFTQGNITIVTTIPISQPPTTPPVQPPVVQPPVVQPPVVQPPVTQPSVQLLPVGVQSRTNPPEFPLETAYRFQQDFVLPRNTIWPIDLIDDRPILVIDQDLFTPFP